jgi:GMP synthase (glutamine-hydrolysing)
MPTSTALVIRHVHFEDLGVFAEPIAAAGYAIRYLDVGIDPLMSPRDADANLLVVLGAPIGVGDTLDYPFLEVEIAAIRARLQSGQPTLGICLGAQLMAHALGAAVRPGPRKEIGWAPVDLTDAGRAGPLRHFDGVPVLHWHGDAFDMPPGAERLASTSICPNQAFSIGSFALACQFHPEADGRRIDRWLIGHTAEIGGVAGLSVRQLREDSARFEAAARAAGRQCISEWLQHITGDHQ